MNSLKKPLFFLFASGLLWNSASATTVNVTVTCSNGANVPNLPISVTDTSGQKIPNIQPTNAQGVFQIEDSELYLPPFYMWFKTKNGSTCGGYYIFIDSNDNGQVQLQYYPTELPCSCSKLVR